MCGPRASTVKFMARTAAVRIAVPVQGNAERAYLHALELHYRFVGTFRIDSGRSLPRANFCVESVDC